MKKVLTFGEILLRLSSPGYTRLFQNDTLQTSFCGAEANVAASLAMFNIPVSFLTKIPDHSVGVAALNSLRYYGVDTSESHQGKGRMGGERK